MTKQQQAVMWMGLILIILRLFTTDQWKQIWGTILKGGGGSSSSSGGGGFDFLNPIPGGGIPGLLGINQPAKKKPAKTTTGGVYNA